MRELPEGCPACGALPCDWANDPHSAAYVRRIEALTEALEKIREGSIARPLGKHWRADCAPSKHDRCIHEKAMWEDCPQCIDEHIHIALAGSDRIAARAALHIRDGE